jgi:hypothetical protein
MFLQVFCRKNVGMCDKKILVFFCFVATVWKNFHQKIALIPKLSKLKSIKIGFYILTSLHTLQHLKIALHWKSGLNIIYQVLLMNLLGLGF